MIDLRLKSFAAPDQTIELPVRVSHGPLRFRPVGVAVHEAARIMGKAAAGEILVSEIARALAQPAGFAFDDNGLHTLKGLEGERHLYAFRAGRA
jgi:class 3 adenylate cyclase